MSSNPGVCNGPGNRSRIVITKSTGKSIAVALLVAFAAAAFACGARSICPSVCPSDWDKRKTPFVSGCLQATYERRLGTQRRGRDCSPHTRRFLHKLLPYSGLQQESFCHVATISGSYQIFLARLIRYIIHENRWRTTPASREASRLVKRLPVN